MNRESARPPSLPPSPPSSAPLFLLPLLFLLSPSSSLLSVTPAVTRWGKCRFVLKLRCGIENQKYWMGAENFEDTKYVFYWFP